MKKLTAWIIGLLVLALPFLILTPQVQAATNLITNPSVETPGSPTTTPQSWLQGNWGSNTAAFTYAGTGQDGTRSVSVSVSNYVSGDAKWYFAPVSVTPGTNYSFSDYYQSTVPTALVAQYTTASGVNSYVDLAQEPASATWAPVNVNFTVPAGVTTMTIFDLINSNGTLTTDNFSLSAIVATAPTVSLTAPTANASIVGTTTLSANASDTTGIKSVQFQVDGVNVGSAVTAAPYQTSWNSTTATNGAHIITAIATNTGGTQTTSAPVSVTVNNVVVSAPTVAITAPTANASIVGSTTLSATASDSTGIANVQFQIDGASLGAAVTAAPYQTSWNSTTVANGSHTVTAIATNTGGTKTTSAPVTVTVNNPTALGTNLISNASAETNANNLPTGWTSGGWGTNTTTFTYAPTGHTGTHSLKVQTTAFTNGDAKWYFTPVNVTPGTSYSFSDFYQSTIATQVVAAVTLTNGSTQYLDLGAPAGSTTWKQFSANFTAPAGATNVTVYHLIAGVGTLSTDDYVLSAATVPTVAINPVAATVSGTVQLTATASDNIGIASVQFKLDGANLGAAITTAPYQLSWNTTTATNGTHSLTAIAINTAGKTTTSAAVTTAVSNAVAPGGNIIPNPGMETVNPTNTKAPQDWTSSVWGTNTTTFTYLTTGHTGGRSVRVQMTRYTDGDAKWYFTPQVVTPGTQYQFSDYYQSTVATEVVAAFTMTDGSTAYEIIGLPDPATAWTKFSTTFTIPLGAQNVTVFHLIQAKGTLTIDDASLSTYVPVGFSRPLVTLSFDDGFATMYSQAMPLLQKYNLSSTQFIVTGLVGTSGYLTQAQVVALNAAGNEIASHTVTHSNLLTETAAQVTTELQQSQATLQSWLGGTAVSELAFPEGMYSGSILNQTKTYYQASRGVEAGLNSKDNFNAYDLKAEDVYSTTTTAQINDWVAQAQATNTWLVLVYHAVDPTDTSIYAITPAQLDAQLAAIKQSGVAVVTMKQALAELKPQL